MHSPAHSRPSSTLKAWHCSKRMQWKKREMLTSMVLGIISRFSQLDCLAILLPPTETKVGQLSETDDYDVLSENSHIATESTSRVTYSTYYEGGDSDPADFVRRSKEEWSKHLPYINLTLHCVSPTFILFQPPTIDPVTPLRLPIAALLRHILGHLSRPR